MDHIRKKWISWNGLLSTLKKWISWKGLLSTYACTIIDHALLFQKMLRRKIHRTTMQSMVRHPSTLFFIGLPPYVGESFFPWSMLFMAPGRRDPPPSRLDLSSGSLFLEFLSRLKFESRHSFIDHRSSITSRNLKILGRFRNFRNKAAADGRPKPSKQPPRGEVVAKWGGHVASLRLPSAPLPHMVSSSVKIDFMFFLIFYALGNIVYWKVQIH